MAEDKKGGSRIIGRVLPAAVRLWLRSQVEQIDSLALDLVGRDRQIISGYIPGIQVSAEQAIYKGIHISRLQLSAEDIRINTGQVLRGKSLRLLQAFPVTGEVTLTEQNLNASLSSPLLKSGLEDFWRSLVQNPAFAQEVEQRYGPISLQPKVELSQAAIRLGDRTLILSFYPQSMTALADVPIVIATGLSVASGSHLKLDSPQWLQTPNAYPQGAQRQPIKSLTDFQWNLGKDTQLTQLSIEPEQLCSTGQIMVNP